MLMRWIRDIPIRACIASHDWRAKRGGIQLRPKHKIHLRMRMEVSEFRRSWLQSRRRARGSRRRLMLNMYKVRVRVSLGDVVGILNSKGGLGYSDLSKRLG